MNASTLITGVAAWLATYLLHSTALILLAALVTLRVRDDGWRDTFWKLALTGGIVSATLQVAFQLRPFGGRHAISSAASSVVPQHEAVTPRQSRVSADRSTPEQSSAPSASSASSAFQKPELGQTPSTSREGLPVDSPSALPTNRPDMTHVLVIAWAAIALLLLFRLAARHIRLFRILADRRQVVEGGLPEMLAELRRNAGIWRPVWLAASPTCPTPLALGASEICVPERFLDDLSREEQRAALAHELAHIARRDPLWHLVAGIIESFLFFQPMNRLARVKMREAAEHLCDDWAVRHVGSEMGLARCLAAVASWIAPGADPIPTGTMAMAEGGSPLLVRVQRLLEHRSARSVVPATARAATAALLLITLVGAAPVFVPWSIAPLASPGRSGDDTTRIIPRTDKPATMSVSPSARAVVPDSVIVFRAPKNGAFAQNFSWARSEALRRGTDSYWIAWAVPSVVPRGETVVEDTRGWSARDMTGRALAEKLGVGSELDAIRGTGQVAVVLLQTYIRPDEIMQIARVSVRTADAGMRIDVPVYWLGTPPANASLALLKSFVQTIGESDHLGDTMLQAIAIHRDDGVMQYLMDVVENPRAEHLHLRALEALQWYPTDDALALLVEVARDGSNPPMQRAAVEAIGHMRHPRAARTLRALIEEIDDPTARRQAVESMGDQPDTMTVYTLVTVAETDGSPEVRRQAAEAIGKLHPREAMIGLRHIIWNSDKRDVQGEAVESLSDVGTRDALNLLMEVIDRHPSVGVQVKAVETLTDFGRDWARPRLIQIARTHPNASVRKQAAEELGDIQGTDSLGRRF